MTHSDDQMGYHRRVARERLRAGRWAEAADCKIVHPYGEEGWRPGGPDQPHEHWVPAPAPGVDEAELKLLSDPDRLARIDAALADPDAATPWTPRHDRAVTNMVDGEIIAPGFRLYSPDSVIGVISDGWVITGRLPTEGPWRMFNHYDAQRKLVEEGLLRPEHCDSELGMFCVHLPDEATARLVGAWLNEHATVR